MNSQDFLKGIKPVTYPGEGGSSYKSPVFTTTPSVNSPIQPINPAKPIYTKADYDAAAVSHPIVSASLKAGNSIEALNYATMTGDISQIVDAYTGMPFSIEDQQKALAQGTKDLEGYYASLKDYETKTAEDALKQKQLDYQQNLAESKVKFESDKATLDQNAAERGVLFSGGRVQKEKALQDTYTRNQNYNQASMGTSISNIARDYQYKYGNEAANSLSASYNLGGNTYNANVARGGVGSSGLSSIYNPSASNYQGTTVNTAKAEANKRAAGYLWNKGNKLVSGGISNKY